jgi:SWI/SNF related-matrix-associated actin-dependent regulator of chromatin subfamily C
VAAAAALGAAAVKARVMADGEEREALRLVQQLVEVQQRKVATKLRYLDQLEEGLLRERAVLEVGRSRLREFQ